MQFILSFYIILWIILTAACAATNPKLDPNIPFVRAVLRRGKAADIKAWIEPDAEPCKDFYRFACGQWQRTNSAKIAKTYSTDKFVDMTKGMQRKVDKLMNQTKTGDVIEDKLRDFYESCKQTEWRRDEYKLALENLYKEYGQFSFVKRKNASSKFNWWSTIADIHRTYGKSIILSLDVEGDIKDKTRTMLYIGPPEFYMLEPEMDRKIDKYLENIFDLNEEQALKVAETLQEFEFELIQGTTDAQAGKSVKELLSRYHVDELIEKYKDTFDFKRFLQLALNTTQIPQQVYLYDEFYLNNLAEVLATSDTQTVEDYILWLLLNEYLIDGDMDDWAKWCSAKSKKYFGKFVDYANYKQYRSLEYEHEVLQLWQEIKEVFREALLADKYQWMSKDVRAEAMRKLENMQLSINTYDGENFQEFFDGLPINATNYVANIQHILKRAESLRQNKMAMKPDGIEDTQVMSFTPVYKSFENIIKLPVALLQPFYVWHPIYPKAIKYATLGFLLAHEMIHGFDDEGRHYDAQGHANNWWDDKSVEEFEKRRSCFQQQYHAYIYDNQPLPSSHDQSENIADNAAVQLAYTAYSHWLEKEKPTDLEASENFPNLDYTMEELFFLSFSQLWCDDVHSEYKAEMAAKDIHAPSMYRVIGSLSNFDKFSEIFKCAPGSAMNPTDKCQMY